MSSLQTGPQGPENDAIKAVSGAALIAAQGATGVALPFGEGLNLQEIQPVVAWVEPYAALYQDYRARLDAATGTEVGHRIGLSSAGAVK